MRSTNLHFTYFTIYVELFKVYSTSVNNYCSSCHSMRCWNCSRYTGLSVIVLFLLRGPSEFSEIFDTS